MSPGAVRHTQTACNDGLMRGRPIAWAGAVVLGACSSAKPTVTVATSTTATTVATTTSASALETTTTSTSAAVPASTTAASRAATTAAPAGSFVCPPVPVRATPREDRSRYTVTVNIDPAASRATGTLSVRFTPDLATDRVVLRLWPNEPELAGAGAHLDAGRVTVNGIDVATSRPN